jgi:hypothetical protein
MFGFSGSGWQRAVVGMIGALVLSTTVVGATCAPVQAAEACLIVPADAGAEQLVCSHA